MITWKSYSILITSLFLLLHVIFLDAVSQISFIYDGILWYLYTSYIPISVIVMLLLIIKSLRSSSENKVIPIIGLSLLFVLAMIFMFFAYLGANFA
ncbi:hypothetical protein [Shouchella miscanthi]|uniref:hypothetical protein n=1 Tax=Shouchella miscanthi TaxID=2598861 RepID=UPI0011A58039|nr:hypothetical protein [Shouchella miscanthi]